MNLHSIHGQNLDPDSWLTFINNCIASDIYHQALVETSDFTVAAAIVMLDSYFDGCSSSEKVDMLRNEAYFKEHVGVFSYLMDGIRYNKDGYDREKRRDYLAMIRNLLQQQKKDGEIKYKNRYDFIKALVRFTSDSDVVMDFYHNYKELYLKIVS